MVRQFLALSVLGCTLLLVAGCHHKVQNPLANIDSKQPDKGLFDRAMDSMKHGRYQEARTLLETLINTYPDSEYIARAKLAVGDSWYREGGTAAWQQAEVEYKDFETFFPNLPEASEAQLKVANIHYRQMEKPDRDFAQAARAAEEYKTLIQTYPDSPLIPEAKQRLREVQEVLAERQYRIAHFYFLRDNLAAAQARLESLVDSYPLYSGVDEALFELGQLYEKEAATLKKQNIADAAKEKLAAQFQKHAIEAYTRIITRYPAMDRADDAKRRLTALNAPVPNPTPEAVAESKAEEQSRQSTGMVAGVLSNFKKHPMTAKAAHVGEPSLEDEKVASAPQMVQELQTQLAAANAPNQKLGLEAVGGGTGTAPGANEPPPGTNGAKPSNAGAPPPAAPGQVNEIQSSPAAGQEKAGTGSNDQTASASNKSTAAGSANQKKDSQDNKQESTSKKKKKTFWKKMNPF